MHGSKKRFASGAESLQLVELKFMMNQGAGDHQFSMRQSLRLRKMCEDPETPSTGF